eukprot:gnl/Chilomastix_caulleri/7154.p2 GENE.gnl/Chilomastix_caulleri/7154~~gnl/Chilomastix_caulleri/7154.p2  ORF type:complete len:65 (-),score=0.26 gnl/Chilomastix_caulleri/7154:2-196(-)
MTQYIIKKSHQPQMLPPARMDSALEPQRFTCMTNETERIRLLGSSFIRIGCKLRGSLFVLKVLG